MRKKWTSRIVLFNQYGYHMAYRFIHPYFKSMLLRRIDTCHAITDEPISVYRASAGSLFFFEFHADPSYLNERYLKYECMMDDEMWEKDFALLKNVFQMDSDQLVLGDNEKYYFDFDGKANTASISHTWRSPEFSVTLTIGADPAFLSMATLEYLIRSFECVAGRACPANTKKRNRIRQTAYLPDEQPVWYLEPVLPCSVVMPSFPSRRL